MTRSLFAVAGLALGATSALGQVYSSAPGFGPIDVSTYVDPIVVSGGPTSITSLSVNVNISTTWCSDVDCALIRRDPVNGDTYLHLFSDVGGSGDNFTITRLVDGAPSIVNGVAPFNGSYAPEGGVLAARVGASPLPDVALTSFADFVGQDANVTWELWVDDDLSGFPATLNYWSLEFNGASDPNGPNAPANGVGSASPSSAISGQTDVVFTVVTSPGFNPASTASTVTIDLSTIGGSASQSLFDDGTNGDPAAGDGTFTFTYAVPGDVATNNYPLTFTVTDTASRTSTGTVTLVVEAPPGPTDFIEGLVGEAGDLIDSALAVAGSGPVTTISGSLATDDVDVFAINICDPAGFSATTFPQVPTNALTDTQIFLFNADGTGVVYNDDVPDGQPGDATLMSSIGSTFVASLTPGTYYLAVSRYNRDPVDAGGALIWANAPFNVERTPDGVSPAGVLSGWTGGTAAGAYKVNLTGTCFIEDGGPSCPACPADYDQDGGVTGADIAAFFADFEAGAPCADTDLDGGVTGGDIGAFFAAFEAGGC